MNLTSRHAKSYMYHQPFARTNWFFYSFVHVSHYFCMECFPGYVTNITTPSTFKNQFISSL